MDGRARLGKPINEAGQSPHHERAPRSGQAQATLATGGGNQIPGRDSLAGVQRPFTAHDVASSRQGTSYFSGLEPIHAMLSRVADSSVENQAESIPIPVCSPDKKMRPQGSEGPKPCGQYAIPVFDGGCSSTVQQVNLSPT